MNKIRTMEDFAALSGLSRPTVSKYFRDPSSVRPSTRERIERAIQDFDYHPNFHAMNQNRRSTMTIGIVVPYLADPFFAEMARRIERRVMQAGFTPSLFSAHGAPAQEVEILDTLRSLRPAGVLMAPLGRTSDRGAIERFCAKAPVVLFDSNIEDVGAAFVGLDNSRSVPAMVEYLCATGDPPCFFEMPPLNPNANKRRRAYIGAMERLGHAPDVVRVPGDTWDFEQIGFTGGARALSERRFSSDTVLCSNDRLAIGLLAAAYERGLRVGIGGGSAIRIAGHDDHPFSRFTSPTLTTMAQDYEAISERSVEIMLKLIEDGGVAKPRRDVLFDGRLVRRASA